MQHCISNFARPSTLPGPWALSDLRGIVSWRCYRNRMARNGSVRSAWHSGSQRKSRVKPPSPFRGFYSYREVIRLVVLMYVRFTLSLRNVEDLLFARGIDLYR